MGYRSTAYGLVNRGGEYGLQEYGVRPNKQSPCTLAEGVSMGERKGGGQKARQHESPSLSLSKTGGGPGRKGGRERGGSPTIDSG